jgi:ribosomal 50S subunit-recycling heat shock protein
LDKICESLYENIQAFSCAPGGARFDTHLILYLGGFDMRLDKYLKVSRLIKRRTVANEACDAGRVFINDKPAKASASVKAGDVVRIQFGNKEVKVEVLDVQETVRKEEAKELFRYLP